MFTTTATSNNASNSASTTHHKHNTNSSSNSTSSFSNHKGPLQRSRSANGPAPMTVPVYERICSHIDTFLNNEAKKQQLEQRQLRQRASSTSNAAAVSNANVASRAGVALNGDYYGYGYGYAHNTPVMPITPTKTSVPQAPAQHTSKETYSGANDVNTNTKSRSSSITANNKHNTDNSLQLQRFESLEKIYQLDNQNQSTNGNTNINTSITKALTPTQAIQYRSKSSNGREAAATHTVSYVDKLVSATSSVSKSNQVNIQTQIPGPLLRPPYSATAPTPTRAHLSGLPPAHPSVTSSGQPPQRQMVYSRQLDESEVNKILISLKASRKATANSANNTNNANKIIKGNAATTTNAHLTSPLSSAETLNQQQHHHLSNVEKTGILTRIGAPTGERSNMNSRIKSVPQSASSDSSFSSITAVDTSTMTTAKTTNVITKNVILDSSFRSFDLEVVNQTSGHRSKSVGASLDSSNEIKQTRIGSSSGTGPNSLPIELKLNVVHNSLNSLEDVQQKQRPHSSIQQKENNNDDQEEKDDNAEYYWRRVASSNSNANSKEAVLSTGQHLKDEKQQPISSSTYVNQMYGSSQRVMNNKAASNDHYGNHQSATEEVIVAKSPRPNISSEGEYGENEAVYYCVNEAELFNGKNRLVPIYIDEQQENGQYLEITSQNIDISNEANSSGSKCVPLYINASDAAKIDKNFTYADFVIKIAEKEETKKMKNEQTSSSIAVFIAEKDITQIGVRPVTIYINDKYMQQAHQRAAPKNKTKSSSLSLSNNKATRRSASTECPIIHTPSHPTPNPTPINKTKTRVEDVNSNKSRIQHEIHEEQQTFKVQRLMEQINKTQSPSILSSSKLEENNKKPNQLHQQSNIKLNTTTQQQPQSLINNNNNSNRTINKVNSSNNSNKANDHYSHFHTQQSQNRQQQQNRSFTNETSHISQITAANYGQPILAPTPNPTPMQVDTKTSPNPTNGTNSRCYSSSSTSTATTIIPNTASTSNDQTFQNRLSSSSSHQSS